VVKKMLESITMSFKLIVHQAFLSETRETPKADPALMIIISQAIVQNLVRISHLGLFLLQT